MQHLFPRGSLDSFLSSFINLYRYFNLGSLRIEQAMGTQLEDPISPIPDKCNNLFFDAITYSYKWILRSLFISLSPSPTLDKYYIQGFYSDRPFFTETHQNRISIRRYSTSAYFYRSFSLPIHPPIFLSFLVQLNGIKEMANTGRLDRPFSINA